MDSINIYYKNILVGVLSYDGIKDKFTLKYDSNWKQIGFKLSPAINFSDKIDSITIKNFIDNLLPEGTHLETLSQYYQVSKNNKYALINAIGDETTGALTFCKDIIDLETTFIKIENDTLSMRIKDRKNIPLSIWDGKPRLSIAGVQDKLPVSILDGQVGFGEGDLASTHILKFDKEDDNLVQNEYLSLFLASKASLTVAEHKLIKIEDELVLQIKRFDRELIDHKVNRFHIIDSVQALDLPLSYKYERNFGSSRDVKEIKEGVSYEKLFSLISLCDNPLIVKKELIKWICVNLILGNSDAHGKNVSFLVSKDSFTLAPFYDILNISIYKHKYEQDMAMAIDEEFCLESLRPYDFKEFYKTININKKLFQKEFKSISKNIISTLELNNFESIYINHDFVELYKDNVLKRVDFLKSVVLEDII